MDNDGDRISIIISQLGLAHLDRLWDNRHMFGIGLPEAIIILLAIGLLFFGSGKIIEFARSLGRLSGEFKKGKADIERELKAAEKEEEDKKKVP